MGLGAVAPIASVQAQAPAAGWQRPQAPQPTAAASAPAAPTAATASTTDELAAVQALSARLQALVDAGGTAPLLEEQRNLAARLALLLSSEGRAAPVTELPAAPSPRAPLEGSGPYPMPEVDALRDELEGLQSQRSSVVVALAALDRQLEERLAVKRRADETLRLKGDQLARTRDGEARLRLQAESEIARLEARIAAIELARVDRDRSAARERAATLSAHVQSLESTLERVRYRQRITDEHLQTVAQDVATSREALTQERRRIEATLAAREAVAATRGPRSDVATREAAALREQLRLLSELELLETGRVEIWRQRRLALAAADATAREETAAVLRRSVDQLQDHLRGLQQQLAQARQTVRLQRFRVDGLPDQSAEAQDERRLLAALLSLVELQEATGEELARLERLLARSLEDLVAAGARAPLPWPERTWAAVKRAAQSIWTYELFSVSDTTRIDGRPVTVDYGVTVGKSVGVVVLFVMGWAVATRVSRAAISLLMRRAGLSEALGRVLNRWVLALLLLGVLILVLKVARIPLTVFAFLGGALAIGLGFGTQNIIKNLISGVIILFERKVRVGDVVTLDGVSGTVMAVDLRATTVRGFDGIDAVVPNSRLLENRVENWTLGNPTVRRTVTVGLAYGHDARRAAELLLACAKADPGVLPVPAPEVLFADFGSHAQVLRLQFWTRLGGPRPGPTVDSDLRHAITSAFAGEGLTIALPQQEVRLHAAPSAATLWPGSERGP
jgi:small-conductance mechanosensitive channel